MTCPTSITSYNSQILTGFNREEVLSIIYLINKSFPLKISIVVLAFASASQAECDGFDPQGQHPQFAIDG